MNASSVTAAARTSSGMDLGAARWRGDPQDRANPHLRLRGAMAHIGSGIHDVHAFEQEVERLLDVQADIVKAGAEPDLLDLGGGLGTRLPASSRPSKCWPTSRRGLPALGRPGPDDLPAATARRCRARAVRLPGPRPALPNAGCWSPAPRSSATPRSCCSAWARCASAPASAASW